MTNKEKSEYKLNSFLKEVLMGNILGDAYMRKSNILKNSRANARVRFLQSTDQSEFVYYLYDLFKDFCVSPLKEGKKDHF